MLINKRLSIGYFLNLIKWDAIAIFCYAGIVGLLDHILFFKGISIPIGLSALVGTLLSLLLAFRTSQSYERWWEARNIWGAIVNDSRTLIRQLLLFLPNEADKLSFIKNMAVRQSIWCYALAHSLRKIEMPEQVKSYIAGHNLQSGHLTNLLLTKQAEDISLISQRYQLNPNMQVQLDTTLQRLTDSMGGCERIKNTVFPRSYSLLIHFLIYVLMTILPFGLDHNNVVVEITIATLIPILFIAIERTAILMQDPFENKPTDTPMDALSQTIERNLMEMAGEVAPARGDATREYFVM
jgi:putative membrane protein